MTVQTELQLQETYRGLRVIESSSKQTTFSKRTVGPQIESSLRQAIAANDDEALAAIVAGLVDAAMRGGWGNAPGGYMLKHNGYMIGMGLYTRSGVRADLSFTVRTNGPIV